MKGDAGIIKELNRLLAGELMAADQYFIHSRMYEDWGLSRLAQRIEHERVEELEHAASLIERILFLEGVPDLKTRDEMCIGATVPEMLRNDLAVELSVVFALKEVIACCEDVRDYQTRAMLLRLLEDTEEDHAYWLEKQLGLIDKMGLENYLQSAAADVANA